MTVGDIYKAIDKLAPFSTQLEWDNSGLIVGNLKAPVTKVYLCLDADIDAVERARELGCELIISHHPAIFRPVKCVSSESVPYRLVAYGISLISAHTNLDIAQRGVNFCLSNVLGLINAYAPNENEPGFIGELPEALEPRDFAQIVATKLNTSVRASVGKGMVKTVGVLGGAGGDYAKEFFTLGADAFVTGEVKHHEFLEAASTQKTLVAAGHYETEQVVVAPLRDILCEEFEGIEFYAAEFKRPTELYF